MGRIRLLGRGLRDKIAAGEVVQGPKSVVKELLENALDAGAGRIQVEIRKGGKEQITVIDDGCGMGPDDIELSVARYATSKIDRVEDLLQITTYGFRGEALASIGAVARLSVTTRSPEADAGQQITVEAGELKTNTKTGRAQGTTITVYDLFFNLPARRKFLKSDEYEKRGIVDMVRAYSLVNPAVAFRLSADGRVIYDLEGMPDLSARLAQIFPKTFSRLVEFSARGDPLSVVGFFSRPGDAELDDRFQYIFVNARPVQHRLIYRAVMEALGRPQPKPAFVVFLQSDPGFVDVNIHPAKTEIRFGDERYAQDYVFQTVRRQLAVPADAAPAVGQPLFAYEPGEDRERGEDFWQLHNSYIVAPTRTGLIIVDQHVAHERIIFEGVLKSRPAVQRLLFPLILELAPEELRTFGLVKEQLNEMGIETKEFSGNVVVVETLPAGAKVNREELEELFVELGGLKAELLKRREEVAKVIACKTAIKAGDRLTVPEMQNLIDRLFACANPYVCPHGRPIVIRFTLDELAHRFGRT